MLDGFNRKIDYLRISVTDRCNHRCIYCMPAKGIAHKSRDEIFTYEQIEAVAAAAAGLGVTKIRLTGGEPLVRRDIERLAGRLAMIAGISELCMTTNGTRLANLAAKLKQNGLTRVNISIDTLDDRKYRAITGGGDLAQALAGLEAAIEADLRPIKINMVILESTTEAQVERMQGFCDEKGVSLQKIMRFSLYDRADLSRRFKTSRPPNCDYCNRLRLTADGFLKPCLFSEHEVKVDFDNITESILRAAAIKPRRGLSCRNRVMCQIGG